MDGNAERKIFDSWNRIETKKGDSVLVTLFSGFTLLVARNLLLRTKRGCICRSSLPGRFSSRN
jgi:hypothetical protein